jgi:hypothetical protein
LIQKRPSLPRFKSRDYNETYDKLTGKTKTKPDPFDVGEIADSLYETNLPSKIDYNKDPNSS